MSTVVERTRREREAQGLPEHVEDDAVLDLVAELLAGSGLGHDDASGGTARPLADREGGHRASP